MTDDDSARPELAPGLSEAEFVRWYWLKDELVTFARRLGIRATGSKEALAARIAAALAGREFAEPAAPRRAATAQLTGALSSATVIPVGQRSSQVVRAWMAEQIGPGFHFDAEMRAFFSQADGTKTMQDAVNHWHETRGGGPKVIDRQFEYNRFTRAWHEAHPDGSREDLLEAWRQYRRRPIDERGRA